MTRPAVHHPALGALQAAAFLHELMMLIVLALCGAALDAGVAVQVIAAVALPTAAATIWAIWMAPTSTHRLPNPRRLAAQVAMFAGTGVLAALLIEPWVGAAFFLVASGVFTVLARYESA